MKRGETVLDCFSGLLGSFMRLFFHNVKKPVMLTLVILPQKQRVSNEAEVNTLGKKLAYI